MKHKVAEKKTEYISVRVSKSVKVDLEMIAEESDRPLSWVVSKVLESHVERKRSKKSKI